MKVSVPVLLLIPYEVTSEIVSNTIGRKYHKIKDKIDQIRQGLSEKWNSVRTCVRTCSNRIYVKVEKWEFKKVSPEFSCFCWPTSIGERTAANQKHK